MALPAGTLPFGCRDIKVTPVDVTTGTYSTMIDLPVGQTLTWKETEDFTELRGDDKVVATRGSGPSVEFDLEQGGISLAAYAAFTGGSVIETGVTPNIVRTFSKTTSNSRPYFRIDGQAINDNGGDTKVILYMCKLTDDIEGGFQDEEFMTTKSSGTGIGDPFRSNKLYDIVASETAANIIQPV
jgi:hypothetical protein